jgi:hypothetical protein
MKKRMKDYKREIVILLVAGEQLTDDLIEQIIKDSGDEQVYKFILSSLSSRYTERKNKFEIAFNLSEAHITDYGIIFSVSNWNSQKNGEGFGSDKLKEQILKEDSADLSAGYFALFLKATSWSKEIQSLMLQKLMEAYQEVEYLSIKEWNDK